VEQAGRGRGMGLAGRAGVAGKRRRDNANLCFPQGRETAEGAAEYKLRAGREFQPGAFCAEPA